MKKHYAANLLPSELLAIEIPSEFLRYAGEVLARLSYLHPEREWKLDGSSIQVTAPESDRAIVQQEVFYGLYREKIREQSLQSRQQLYELLLKP